MATCSSMNCISSSGTEMFIVVMTRAYAGWQPCQERGACGPAGLTCLRLVLLPERPRHPLAAHQRDDLLARGDAAALGPRVVLPRHLLDAPGLLRREVVQLGPVGIHVVQLPGARITLHELPLSDAHR